MLRNRQTGFRFRFLAFAAYFRRKAMNTSALAGQEEAASTESSAVQVRGLDLNALERLRRAVSDAGGPKAVAEKAGVAISTLNAATSGRNEPKIGLIAQLADVMGVSIDWIVRGDAAQSVAAPQSSAASIQPRSDVALVPYYNVRASAGPGSMPDREAPLMEVEIDKRFMRLLGVSPSNAAVLTVHGDSGEPNLSEGDAILIDRSLKELRDGGLYVIGVDDDVLVKRVARQADRSILLLSDNQAYPSQRLSPADADSLRVIGRVRWAIREY